MQEKTSQECSDTVDTRGIIKGEVVSRYAIQTDLNCSQKRAEWQQQHRVVRTGQEGQLWQWIRGKWAQIDHPKMV